MIQNRLLRNESAFMSGSDAERDHERDDRRNRDGSACDESTECLVFQPAADEPIDQSSGERCENDYAYEVVFNHYSSISSIISIIVVRKPFRSKRCWPCSFAAATLSRTLFAPSRLASSLTASNSAFPAPASLEPGST